MTLQKTWFFLFEKPIAFYLHFMDAGDVYWYNVRPAASLSLLTSYSTTNLVCKDSFVCQLAFLICVNLHAGRQSTV
jgi:hypothetical protein